MSNNGDLILNNEVPVFAAATGATSYKIGTEAYVDLMFLRPVFNIGENQQDLPDAPEGTMSRETHMALKTVSSITLTESQAKQLIVAIEDQLKKIKSI